MAGKVWTTFVAKKQNGIDVKLRIQDMPAERLDEVINLFEDYYNTKDVFHRFIGVSKNPEAVKESSEGMRQMFKAFPPSTIICCEDNGDQPGRIVGAAASGILTPQDDSKLEEFVMVDLKTKEIKELYTMYFKLMKLYDVFKERNVDSYSGDRGLAVSSDYGVGVLEEMLTVIRKQCKDRNLPIAGLWAMSNDLQEAAKAAGFQTVFEISREEAGKKLGVTITEDPPTYKFVIGDAL